EEIRRDSTIFGEQPRLSRGCALLKHLSEALGYVPAAFLGDHLQEVHASKLVARVAGDALEAPTPPPQKTGLVVHVDDARQTVQQRVGELLLGTGPPLYRVGPAVGRRLAVDGVVDLSQAAAHPVFVERLDEIVGCAVLDGVDYAVDRDLAGDED